MKDMNEENFNSDQAEEDAKSQMRRRGGLKVDASKSQFSKKNDSKASFEDQANAVFDGIQERKQRAAELVQQFWSFVMDETLLSEKGPIKKNLEKEIVNKLVRFASEMNNDPNEPEGFGSVAVIVLLLKAILYLRDKNNELSYKVASLEQKINKVSSAHETNKSK